MYLDHFGLDSTPFNITSQTDFFYDGAARGATLDALLYAVQQGEGIVKVTGEVGSGKTMLCRMLHESLPDNVETIFFSMPSLKREEIVQALCIELGLDIAGQTQYQLFNALQTKLIELYAGNRRVLALIDEAHAMPLESLEQIRLLTNLENGDHKLLQIILFGQPELDDHLRLPHMRQLKERITHSFQLKPLKKPEVGPYLAHRLESAGYTGPDLFSDACIALIAPSSEGLTRRINIIADKSLLAAYSENTKMITPQHVRAAIRDSDFPLPSPWKKRITLGALTVVAAGAIAFGMSQTNWFAPKADTAVTGSVANEAKKPSGSAQTVETALEPATGVALIEGTPEWHERNINKNNKLSKYVVTASADSMAEANSGLNSVKSVNLAENLAKLAYADKKSERLATATGFDLDSKISPGETRPSETTTAKPDAGTEAKNTSTTPNISENTSKIKQPSQTEPVAIASKVAELKVTAPSPADTSITKPSTPASSSGSLLSGASEALQSRIKSSKSWLESQNPNQCVIQLLIADINNHGNVENFLSQAERQIGTKTGVHVFPSEINRQGKYIVSYADTGMNCETALGKLPAALKQSKPYIRSVGLLRNEAKFPG
jgi:type II secretory pathway predicted ATPase ExeA